MVTIVARSMPLNMSSSVNEVASTLRVPDASLIEAIRSDVGVELGGEDARGGGLQPEVKLRRAEKSPSRVVNLEFAGWDVPSQRVVEHLLTGRLGGHHLVHADDVNGVAG